MHIATIIHFHAPMHLSTYCAALPTQTWTNTPTRHQVASLILIPSESAGIMSKVHSHTYRLYPCVCIAEHVRYISRLPNHRQQAAERMHTSSGLANFGRDPCTSGDKIIRCCRMHTFQT